MDASPRRQPHAAEPASTPDIGWAIRRLTEADLLRLRALARLRVRGMPGSVAWSDLLHEAIVRALDGSRRWPPGVALVAFLAGIMRSLADESWRHLRRDGPHCFTPDLVANEDPERHYAAGQALAAMDRLFKDDPVGLRILAGLADGLTAAEIRATYALSQLDYDTARRRIRRALLRHGLAGARV